MHNRLWMKTASHAGSVRIQQGRMTRVWSESALQTPVSLQLSIDTPHWAIRFLATSLRHLWHDQLVTESQAEFSLPFLRLLFMISISGQFTTLEAQVRNVGLRSGRSCPLNIARGIFSTHKEDCVSYLWLMLLTNVAIWRIPSCTCGALYVLVYSHTGDSCYRINVERCSYSNLCLDRVGLTGRAGRRSLSSLTAPLLHALSESRCCLCLLVQLSAATAYITAAHNS